MKMKKVKCSILAAFAVAMIFGTGVLVHASESNANVVEGNAPVACVLSEGTYEGEQLQAAAEMLGYDMVTEDGYVLESISVKLETNEDEPVMPTDTPVPRALGDYIGDVVKAPSDMYFPDSPIASNWYDGPHTKLIKTYTRSVSALHDSTVEVSDAILNAGLTFNVAGSEIESTEWERPEVTSSQKINVKEYGVYEQYSFTIYNIWGKQKGTGRAFKPMGLYITQAIYSK